MVYGHFKDLNRRIFVDEVLRDKAFNIAKDPKMMDINMDLPRWFIHFSIEKLLGVVLKIFLIKIS